jgi:hypothetical protein
MKSDLKLDWCSYQAAKYAVEHWHYSKRLPLGSLVKIGVWESSAFIGVIVFAHGATPDLGTPYRCTQFEACELARVALTKHNTPVSRILAIAVKMLALQCPKLRIIVSFADANQGHIGGIYQAAGWIYTGRAGANRAWKLPNGKIIPDSAKTALSGHGRWRASRYQQSQAIAISQERKYRYLMPLDSEMRQQIEPLRKSYPKRAVEVNDVTSGVQPGKGGETPTRPLQNLMEHL